jgi:hypothetical protein
MELRRPVSAVPLARIFDRIGTTIPIWERAAWQTAFLEFYGLHKLNYQTIELNKETKLIHYKLQVLEVSLLH